ncbi:Aminoglycoside-2''-adenylyltransferase [Cellulomonas flavigena DSM 20109]|uniref:Aminoglycoside-2''-adenylyltransferase n=2 Tax=Cellulomonas flavigena TaxID=1711 RepID=D5UHS4_CELFN|nr:Aminoglycoside-2''-adenylyltransferase [Cellulomonas flavigena DSM 20109]
MTIELVHVALDSFDRAGVAVWIGGGWGIDALVGRQTREHRDLDLMYRIEDDPQIREVLSAAGYVAETDWWPVRVEFRGPSYVDVHPLDFAPDGSATQAGLDGARFEYPASAFVHGTIDGRRVGCLSAEQQRLFHSGYELREIDHADLAALASALLER